MHFIEFNIRYDVNDGAAVHLCYILRDGSCVVEESIPLREVQKGWWQCSMEVDDRYANINYGYELRLGGSSLCSEWAGTPHTLRFNCVNRNYIVYDMWLDSPAGCYARTAPDG